jgi:hypothetical protein
MLNSHFFNSAAATLGANESKTTLSPSEKKKKGKKKKLRRQKMAQQNAIHRMDRIKP